MIIIIIIIIIADLYNAFRSEDTEAHAIYGHYHGDGPQTGYATPKFLQMTVI